MKRLMCISERFGHEVSGSDARMGGHDAKNVIGKQLVVYSGAIRDDNDELVCARKIGIPVMERADFLAFLAENFDKKIAIAGCHGKTTTTAMLAEIMRSKKPTLHVGAEYSYPEFGEKGYFITEACEYRRSLLSLKPDVAVVTNIDFDHPDTYRDLDEVKATFREFALSSKVLIYNGDDEACREAFFGLAAITFGFNEGNDYVIKVNSDGFDLFFHGAYAGSYAIFDKSRFNILNATAAICCGFNEKLCFHDIADGLKNFSGVARRGEVLERSEKCDVISDYAHHPAEIRARIEGLKAVYASVAVIFQPHTYSRTEALLSRFVEAFDDADFVAIAPTFAAREKKGDDWLLFREVKGRRECCFVEREEVFGLVERLKERYDAVVIMGAGDLGDKVDFRGKQVHRE